jgi:AefR-like transcriptional repressor, C-terminal domain
MAAKHAEHFALVHQVNAEVEHVPPEAIDAWQRTGPLRVRHALAERLRALAERGLLHIDNPERSALQLMLLISAESSSHRSTARTEQEITETVAAGVHTFLYGHTS